MYILLSAFIIVFVLKVAEVFFHAPAIFDRAMEFIDTRYPRSYLSLFFMPIAAVLVAYALAIVAGAAVFGVAEACKDLGTACALIFLINMIRCWLSFGKDVAGQAGRLFGGNGPAARAQPLGSETFVFLFGVYGSLGLVVLKTLDMMPQ